MLWIIFTTPVLVLAWYSHYSGTVLQVCIYLFLASLLQILIVVSFCLNTFIIIFRTMFHVLMLSSYLSLPLPVSPLRLLLYIKLLGSHLKLACSSIPVHY